MDPVRAELVEALAQSSESRMSSWSSSEWGALGSVMSGIASMVALVGLLFVWKQLRATERVAQAAFEDGLTKEYRDLAAGIPTEALLGEPLNEVKQAEAFDEFFRYVDLSNEQVGLRARGRVSLETWKNWSDGIKGNLNLPSFKAAWAEIRHRGDSFAELRRAELESFLIDPATWSKSKGEC